MSMHDCQRCPKLHKAHARNWVLLKSDEWPKQPERNHPSLMLCDKHLKEIPARLISKVYDMRAWPQRREWPAEEHAAGGEAAEPEAEQATPVWLEDQLGI